MIDATVLDEAPDSGFLDMLYLFHNIKDEKCKNAPDRKQGGDWRKT
jgi:hypothetical protein